MNTAKFYWAIVGDASPEPVAVVEQDGKRVAYTCGCPDPFDVDGPGARIQLVPATYAFDGSDDPDAYTKPADWWERDTKRGWEVKPLDVPMKPKAAAAKRRKHERQLATDRANGIRHGHRRFNP